MDAPPDVMHLPTHLAGQAASTAVSGFRKAKKRPARTHDDKAQRKAALEFEREEKRLAREREWEEAAQEKERCCVSV